MKKHLTIFLFASLSFCAFSQNQIKVTMPQIVPGKEAAETPISNLLNCYPNPTTGLVTVSLNKASDSDYNVQIYNDLGVLLLQITKAKSETNFTIDISEYPTGQFFVHINSDNQSYVGRVTKVKR